jgi:aminopeptidase
MFEPSEELLAKYADLVVNFGLWEGKGINQGEKVLISGNTHTIPFIKYLQRAILKSGGVSIYEIEDEELTRDFIDHASEEQARTVFENKNKGMVEDIDHHIKVAGELNPLYLQGAPQPQASLWRQKKFSFLGTRQVKELEGKLSWSLILYPSTAMAKEANMTLEEYWQEMSKALYLDEADPIAKWNETQIELKRITKALNEMPIDTLHLVAPDTDLHITLGKRRVWEQGCGVNLPSFEIFCSPDWRGTHGKIQTTEPLYYNGQLIKDIYMEFKDGCITKAIASSGQEALNELVAIENTDKIGEFSLTDGRHSRIEKFMADTLYDENAGGPQGNTHFAIGMAYKDLIDGDPKTVTKEEYDELGFNDANEHVDIVSRSPRTVTATLKDGSQVVIYDQGQFKI